MNKFKNFINDPVAIGGIMSVCPFIALICVVLSDKIKGSDKAILLTLGTTLSVAWVYLIVQFIVQIV